MIKSDKQKSFHWHADDFFMKANRIGFAFIRIVCIGDSRILNGIKYKTELGSVYIKQN